MTRNEEEVSTGRVANVSVIRSMRRCGWRAKWPASANRAGGRHRADRALGPMVAIHAGDRFAADIDGLGSVTATFVAQEENSDE